MPYRSVATLTAAVALSGAAWAEVPKVATDITPVHSLVARVMQGVGAPSLIVAPGATPHGYSMRPSEAAALDSAEIVVWIGPELTPWLEDAIGTLAGDAHSLALLDAPETRTLPFRQGARFAAHDHGDDDDHDDHGQDDHGQDDHGHDDQAHDDHGHDDHADEDHGHDHAHDAHAEGHDDHAHDDHAEGHDEHAGHDHGHDGIDPHAWLDPANARAWLSLIAAELSEHDPDNAARYSANAETARDEIAQLEAEIAGQLDPLGDVPFLVFHDAYQYFETRFGITAAGAISLSDASDPSAARIAELRDLAASRDIACVFAEPQFDPKLVETVFGGVARRGVVDPLAVGVDPGPGLYPVLMRDMADSLAQCLGGQG